MTEFPGFSMPLISHSLQPDTPAGQQDADYKPDTKVPAR